MLRSLNLVLYIKSKYVCLARVTVSILRRHKTETVYNSTYIMYINSMVLYVLIEAVNTGFNITLIMNHRITRTCIT